MKEIIKRIEKLEEKAKRFLPNKPIKIEIHFINPDGSLSSILILDGKGKRRYEEHRKKNF